MANRIVVIRPINWGTFQNDIVHDYHKEFGASIDDIESFWERKKSEIGLKSANSDTIEFEVVDENVFMLAMIRYGIVTGY